MAEIKEVFEAAVAGADPQFSFVLTHAEANKNGDYFPDAELREHGATITGRKIDMDHSEGIPAIVGAVIAQEYIPETEAEKSHLLCRGELYVNETEHAKLAYKLMQKQVIKHVSMECEAEAVECSICRSKSANKLNACQHIRESRRGNWRGQECFSILHGINFTGVGLLSEPGADPGAKVLEVAALDESEIITQLINKLGLPADATLNDILLMIDALMNQQPSSSNTTAKGAITMDPIQACKEICKACIPACEACMADPNCSPEMMEACKACIPACQACVDGGQTASAPPDTAALAASMVILARKAPVASLTAITAEFKANPAKALARWTAAPEDPMYKAVATDAVTEPDPKTAKIKAAYDAECAKLQGMAEAINFDEWKINYMATERE